MPRFTRYRVTALLLTSVVGLCAVPLAWNAAVPGRHVFRATYDVHIESASPIREAGGVVYAEHSTAERVARRWPPEDCDRIARPSYPHGRWRLQASAICAREWSWFGRDDSYTQESYLAVVAVLADGRRIGKVIELPDARAWEDEPREVTVLLE